MNWKKWFQIFKKTEAVPAKSSLQEGPDFYINAQGLMVFTKEYHLKRGYCCKSGCLHCPYGYRKN